MRDWCCIVHIANIDVDRLTGDPAANLISMQVTAARRDQRADRNAGDQLLSWGRPAIDVNRAFRTALVLQALNRTNILL
ncbi:phage major capsid protein [Komagataeibacter sp. FNDCR2]|uniref:phage major capsid protein n=1 Tax=Komagataeibacter sp. FNDCR2 TaxID=2878682 RepID=UPI001E49DD78|nr:hypothetical protein [Komagataeibacter sp. FNDCR2]MCE2574792.1 hypothetical protein [Komagataeibacter sp. FNDCR2]